jgi:hypothetical protein
MPRKSIADHSGTIKAVETARDRDLSRSQWLEECFPEWGTYLNQQIEKTEVKPGKEGKR